jgi:hypothetical protein
MTGLEQRYRTLLRVLPASYRAAWEEEMVVSFLESIQTGDTETDEIRADYGRPPWSEVASVLALAVRLRTGGAGGTPRFLAFGRAVRLFVLMGLLERASDVLAFGSLRLWLGGRLTFLPAPPSGWIIGPSTDFLYRAQPLGWVAWLVAYVAVVLGRWRVARAVAALAVALHVASVISQALMYRPGTRLGATTWYLLAFDLILLAGLAAHHRSTVRAPALPWLFALVGGAASTFALILLPDPLSDWPPLLDWPGLCCLAYLGAAAGYAARRAASRTDWAYALALFAPIVLTLRVTSIVDYLAELPGSAPTLLTITTGQAILVALAGVALTVRTVRTVRDLPAVAASPS